MGSLRDSEASGELRGGYGDAGDQARKTAQRRRTPGLGGGAVEYWSNVFSRASYQISQLGFSPKLAKICQDSTVLVWQCNRQLSRVFMIFLDEHSTVANTSSKAWTCVAQLDVQATMAYTRGHA